MVSPIRAALRPQREAPAADHWLLDEVFLQIQGRRQYLRASEDSCNNASQCDNTFGSQRSPMTTLTQPEAWLRGSVDARS